MQLSLAEIEKAIAAGSRTDCQGRDPVIDPHTAALHVHALLVERGLIEKIPAPKARRIDWHYDSQGYCDNPGRGY